MKPELPEVIGLSKVLIQGLGEVPKTNELVMEREKPEATFVLASDYQLECVASEAGYEEANEEVVKSAAKDAGTDLTIKKCDPFDLDEISDVLGEVLQELGPDVDEVAVNYTGGSANMKLVLGMIGITLSRIYPTKLIYAIEYPEETKIVENNAEKLKDIYRSLNELL